MAFVDITNPEWTTPPDVFRASDFAQRYYCKICGSSIGMKYNYNGDRNVLGVTLGTVDVDCDFVPKIDQHIFLESKPAWAQVPDDGARRFQKFDADGTYEKKILQYRESLGTK